MRATPHTRTAMHYAHVSDSVVESMLVLLVGLIVLAITLWLATC